MSLIEEALKKRHATAAAKPLKVTVPPSMQVDPVPAIAAAPIAAMPRKLGDPQKIRHLNREKLQAGGMLPPDSEARQMEHQFRTIKRPLIRKAFGDAPDPAASMQQRTIMVSSALPGDGKTFSALNLALSLAMERDYSVILVDGDVAKPHVSKLFEAHREPGLLDVLENPKLDIESVILPTDVPGLSLLPVGRQSRQATELLASARMRKVLADLQSLDPLSITVVDSPPILLTSEARVLASLFGQVVMVVRAGGTPKQAVLDAIKMLGESAQVSLVLNQAIHGADGEYYGYGTKYGYGDTAAQGTQE